MQLNKIMQSIIGAALGLLCALAVELMILAIFSGMSGRTFYPRGLGWVVAPVLGAILGWQFGKDLRINEFIKSIAGRLDANNFPIKLWLAVSIFWIICVVMFYIIFNPYGSYWSTDELLQFWEVLLAPPALAFLGQVLFRWSKKGNFVEGTSRGNSDTTRRETPSETGAATILKSGVIDGMAYKLYSNGSVDIKLKQDQDVVHFASIEQLSSFLKQNR